MASTKTFIRDKFILLFDGDCPLCNYWVRFVLKRDNKDQFRFAPLQSPFAQDFLKSKNLEFEKFDTIYLISPQGVFFSKSQAIFKILNQLGGIYKVAALGRILPKVFTDRFYDAVAKRRKKVPVKYCVPLDREASAKFINE